MIWLMVAQGFQFVAPLPVGDTGWGLRLFSSTLWVGGASHLYSVDVSFPSSPSALDSIPSGQGVDLAFSGNDVLVMATPDSGMQVFYVWNPSQIQAAYTTGGSALAMDARGTVAYVATPSGMDIYDVTNPYLPSLMGSWSGVLQDLRVWGDFAYVVGGTALRILNVTNPSGVVEAGTATLGAAAHAVDLDSVNLWVFVGTDQGLEVWDINTPSSPVRLGQCSTSAPVIRVRYRPPQYVFLVEGNHGVEVFDMLNPASCTRVGFLSGTYQDVAVSSFSLGSAYVYTAGASSDVWQFTPTGVKEKERRVGFHPFTVRPGILVVRRALRVVDPLGRIRQLNPGVHHLSGTFVVRERRQTIKVVIP